MTNPHIRCQQCGIVIDGPAPHVTRFHHKNKIISIGYIGCMRSYLNVPMAVAIARYTETDGNIPEPRMIHEFGFDDEFHSYDGGGAL